jgi:hypothetical protein
MTRVWLKYYFADKPISGVDEPRSAGVTRATTTRMNTKSAAEVDAKGIIA